MSWAVAESGSEMNLEQSVLNKIVSEIVPPAVESGPVAFAIHYSFENREQHQPTDWIPMLEE